MKELLQLNKKYLINLYYWVSGLFTLIYLIFLVFFYKEIQWKWSMLVLFCTLIVIPVFLVFMSLLDAYNNKKYLQKICSYKPFSELNKIGFIQKKLMNVSVNGLKDNAIFSIKEGIPIFIKVDNKKPKIIEFVIYCNSYRNYREYIIKLKELESKNIDLDIVTISIKINTKKEKISLQSLEMRLNELVHVVKINKFEVHPLD